MTSATKSMLKATLAVYNKRSDKEAFIKYEQERLAVLEKEPLRLARGTVTQNQYRATLIFLRIMKQKDEVKINHTERAHALLSASGASRWMACTPSARLEEQFENKSSSFAEEGTLAHELAEIILSDRINPFELETYKDKFRELAKSEYFSEDMTVYVEKHVDYVLQQFTEAKRTTPDAVLLIEQKVDITHLIEDGFGTCDVIIIADGVLEVIDLKYGMGVRVSAENNSQLKLYGAGALEAYEMLYDVHTVRLTIIQPRMDSISSWEISADDLRHWGETEVKAKALLAYAGEGEQVTGDHCRFCRASARCKAQADLTLQTIKDDFADPRILTDSDLVDIYKKAPNIEKWLKTVAEYMYSEALEGKNWDEFKLVEGQSRRGWTDEKAVIMRLKKDYKAEEIGNFKVKGIGDIEKLVGKNQFPDLLGDIVTFKKTSPSLVPISDKRPAMGIDQLKADFATDL